MRRTLIVLCAGFVLLAVAGESQAQYRTIFSRNVVVAPAPYYYGPPLAGSTVYSSPYGYQTYSNYAISPGPYGYAYSSSGTSIRPYYSGPYHSIYWDPFANTYRYTGGYLNTPSYYYRQTWPY